MARVRLVQKADASSEAMEMLQRIEERGARVLNMHRAVANSPAVGRDFFRLGISLMRHAKLAPQVRELVVLRVAHLCASKYEWVQHVPVALGAGVTQAQVEALTDWAESTAFSNAERAALQYTDEVTRNVSVGNATFRALRQHFDDQEILELTLAAAFWGAVARLLVALEVDLD